MWKTRVRKVVRKLCSQPRRSFNVRDLAQAIYRIKKEKALRDDAILTKTVKTAFLINRIKMLNMYN